MPSPVELRSNYILKNILIFRHALCITSIVSRVSEAKIKFMMKYISSISVMVFGVFLMGVHFETKQKSYKIPKRDRIEYAAAQEYMMTVDPALGRIPKDRLIAAQTELRNRRLKKSNTSNSLIWKERGPNNVGGRVRAAIFDRSDASNKTVFAAGISGGLWKTNNIQSNDPNWQPIDDFFSSIAISAIAQDPNNYQHMYFGTGEGYFDHDASPGMGIWRSTDGGNTWSHLSSTIQFEFIQDIKVIGGGVIIASTKKGVYKSQNYGSSWTKVLGISSGATVNEANRICLASNGDMYVSMGIYSQGGIYKSINQGNSWSKLTNGLPTSGYERIEIALSESSNQTVYALYQSAVDGTCMGIYKSTNGGSSWSSKPLPSAIGLSNFARNQAWYNLSIGVDPNDDNKLIIGGIDLFKSSNGGDSWTQLSHWGGLMAKQLVHADQHLIKFAPNSSQHVLIGNDGGIWYSQNANASIPDIYAKNKGLNITQFYAAAMHPNAGSHYFLAGAQDNGTQKFTMDGVNSTTEASGGDGAYCFIDKENPNIQITSYVFNNYFVSLDGGQNFSIKTLNDHGFFANPCAYDSHNKKLYSSTSAGKYLRWENVTAFTPQTTEITVSGMSGQKVSFIEISPQHSNRLYIGTDSGDVFLVDNAHTGSSKSAIKIRDGQGAYVSSIDVDSQNDQHIVISYSNYGVASIFETFNGGLTWNDVEGNLPDIPVRSVLIHPTTDHGLIIGTETGVFTTTNTNGQNTQWIADNNGLANVRTDMLCIRPSDNLLLAATHGRGLFTSSSLGQVKGGFESSSYMSMEETIFSGYGNCDEDYWTIDIPVSLTAWSGSTESIQVSVSSIGTTATQSKDYKLNTNSISFTNSASLTKQISIQIIDDAIMENTEYIKLKLSSSTVDLTGNDEISISIMDNDHSPMSGSGGGVQIGSANTTERDFPFGGYYEDGRVQMIFKASELAMMGLQAGPINGLAFDIATKSSDTPFSGFTIKMQHTSLNSANLANTPFESGGAQVYSSDLTTSTGWNDFTFSSPFTWNGSDNIIVECCYNNSDWSDDDYVKTTQTTFKSVQYRQADGNIGCNLSTVHKNSFNRPNIRFFQSSSMDIADDLCTKSSYIAANQEAHFYNHDQQLIASIKSLGSSPLGCLDLSIDQKGSGSYIPSWSNNMPISDKSFYIDAVSSQPYEITLYYSAAEMQQWADPLSLSILKTEVAIPQYNNQGYQIADGRTTVIDMGGGAFAYKATFTGFSGFAIADATGSTGVLPVEWLDISVHPSNIKNRLNWTLAEQINVSHYVIEKSYDGRVFEEIGDINVKETSTKYFFDDYQLDVANQYYYYRIKSVDLDGSIDYSTIVSTFVKDHQESALILAFPNPLNDRVRLNMTDNIDLRSIRLMDVSGRAVQMSLQNLDVFTYTFELDMTDHKSGVYFLSYSTLTGDKKTLKLIKN